MSQFDTENKDVLLAMALAAGASAADAGRQLDVSVSTVKRRMSDPDFRRFVADLRGQMLEPPIRIRAARALLSFGLRLHDAVDVTERVRRLEEELDRRPEALP
jgi:hypothetical protein